MKTRCIRGFVVASLGLALGLVGCASSGGTGAGSGGTGSGGKGSGGSGSGGATATGGTTSSGGKPGSGGATATGGTTATGGVSGSGGATTTGGVTGSGGGASASGGNPGSGGGTGTGSGGSSSGGAGGTRPGSGGATGWSCPPASSFTGSPLPGTTVAATRITGAPPADSFNNMGNNFTNVEGPVWIGDSLYVSEFLGDNMSPASRILKIAADDSVSSFITDSGSNGLAVDGAGNIVSANHKAHGLVRFSLPDKTATTLVSMANSKPLNSPNDLTVAADGTIYFTDPDYQDASNPQGMTRVYQVAPGATTATAVTDYTTEPNGITLSLDEQTLFVGGKVGVKKYAITAGAVAMTGAAFGPTEVTMSGVNIDGMTIDCAGNLYVTVGDSTNVIVVKPDGTKVGTVTISGPKAVTNVAFGGADHQTLYLTGQGSGKGQGVFKVHLNIPGHPY